MRVSIPLKNLETRVFEGQSWTVDRFPSDVTAEASHTALYDFLVSPMDEKKRAILGSDRVSEAVPLAKVDSREAAGGRSHAMHRRFIVRSPYAQVKRRMAMKMIEFLICLLICTSQNRKVLDRTLSLPT
jgi:hypothetical protein